MSSIIECIKTVGRGERSRKPLSFDQAYQVMKEYLAGEVSNDKMAMLMMLIRVQNETVEEISGFTTAIREFIRNEQTPELKDLNVDIDWACFAGKRQVQGPSWQLYAAQILANKGFRVLIHGHLQLGSTREHVSQVIDKLNIPSCSSIAEVHKSLDEGNIAYLPLSVYAPQVETMLLWQHEYGLRTPANTCARMLNPASAPISLRGSFHPGLPQLHGEAESRLQQATDDSSELALCFKGMGGESEFNPKVSQSLWCASKGVCEELYWEEALIENLPIPQSCLLGTKSEQLQLMANTVIFNVANVLWANKREENYPRVEAIKLATQYWEEYVKTIG